NNVDPEHVRRISIGDHERRYILDDLRAAARDREPAEPAKLVNGGEPAHDRVIAHLNVAREGAVVRKHHLVPDVAIVANMAVGEKISAMPNPRLAIRRRAAGDGDEFPKRVLVADFEISRFALVFQVLGLLSYRAISVK